MLDFFNTMNEDGTLARPEEKYLGHGDDFDYVDTRSFLRAVDSVLPDLQPLFEKYARKLTGNCWRLFLIRNPTGIPVPRLRLVYVV